MSDGPPPRFQGNTRPELILQSRCSRHGRWFVGRCDEWHLNVPNSFRHLTFQHPARLHHLVELDWRAFSLARLESVWPICHAMKCYGVEQLLVEGGAERGVAAPLKVDQRLKRLKRLQRPFEADRSRLHSVLRRGLR